MRDTTRGIYPVRCFFIDFWAYRRASVMWSTRGPPPWARSGFPPPLPPRRLAASRISNPQSRDIVGVRAITNCPLLFPKSTTTFLCVWMMCPARPRRPFISKSTRDCITVTSPIFSPSLRRSVAFFSILDFWVFSSSFRQFFHSLKNRVTDRGSCAGSTPRT